MVKIRWMSLLLAEKGVHLCTGPAITSDTTKKDESVENYIRTNACGIHHEHIMLASDFDFLISPFSAQPRAGGSTRCKSTLAVRGQH